MDEFEIEIKKDFLQEAKDLVESTEQSFLQLEQDPNNKTLLDSIFRFAHNLKGTSRAVGFGQIAELTHVAENLLLSIKKGDIKVNDHIVSTLLVFNDKVREMVEGLSENMEAQFECHDLIKKLEGIINGQVPVNTSEPDLTMIDEPVTEEPPKASAFEAEEQSYDEDLMAEALALCGVTAAAPAEVSVPEVISAPVEVIEKKAEPKKEQRKDDETLRVSLNRLEKLNDMVGELVILQTLVENSLSKHGEHKTARSLGKLCKEIQDLSMSLRMVQIGPTFQKLTRVVRDTSKLLNKKVKLQLLGEETEIDKTVVESLGDPLVHIIRNAIDHGVETPEERVMKGKSEEGTVEIMAFHEGNFLVIQITDDGKGIDPHKLIAKAREIGIISPKAVLTDQQGIELIFHPGFSSKDEVSEVSGRGVGMDVVKTNIEALGGEVKVRSKIGSGSCFRLMLPLTLAIIEGMLIESGSQTYIIPKGQIQEVIKLESEQLTKVTGRLPYFSLRKEIVPLFHLDDDMGAIHKKASRIAIVVQNGGKVFAVAITDVVRQQQVVVKPPTKEIAGKPGIMGTTILGDGRPALILDLLSLYSKRIKKESSADLTAVA